MSQSGKFFLGGSGSNALATTIVADVGQAQGRNGILNALGGSNINTVAADAHTIQINLDNTVMVDEASIGNIRIYDNTFTTISLNGNIILFPLGGQKVTYDNVEINPNSFLYFGDESRLYSTNTATDGQILIGSDSGIPVAANITAGDNVTIQNSSNNITISTNAAGTGFVNQWVIINSGDYPNNQPTTYVMQPNTGYIVNWGYLSPAVLSLTLPPVSSLKVGDYFSVICNVAWGCDSTKYSCPRGPNSVYIDGTSQGYVFIAPYQPVNLVSRRFYPVTYGGGGGTGKPCIGFVYTGNDVNLDGGNQPLMQVVLAMGVWKF